MQLTLRFPSPSVIEEKLNCWHRQADAARPRTAKPHTQVFKLFFSFRAMLCTANSSNWFEFTIYWGSCAEMTAERGGERGVYRLKTCASGSAQSQTSAPSGNSRVSCSAFAPETPLNSSVLRDAKNFSTWASTASPVRA